jgi:hypothetical protein
MFHSGFFTNCKIVGQLKVKDASPYEFDLVINRDFIQDASYAAQIVETAFREKFKIPLKNSVWK